MIQQGAFLTALLVVSTCTCILGVVVAIVHFVIEFLARYKHGYKHTTSEVLVSFIVFMDLSQIFLCAIPVTLNYYNGSWKLGASMCYVVVFFIELLPAGNLFSLCMLVYSIINEIPLKPVVVLLSSSSVIVVLFSIPMLMKAEHKDHYGDVHCYVEDDWTDNSWLNYETYIITYAVIFLLAPCLIALFMVFKSWRAERNLFLMILVSTFCVAIIPRLICEIIFVMDYKVVNIQVWIFVHFLGIYRFCSVPFIYLLHPLTLPRYKSVFNRQTLGSSLSYTYCSDNQTLVPQHAEIEEDDRSGINDDNSFENSTSLKDHLVENESPPDNSFLVNIE